MEAGIIRGAVTVHSPRIGMEARAPDFTRGLIAGIRALGDEFRAAQPDVIVLQSTHWVSTFPWYTTCLPSYEGVCVADEAPDLVPGIPYRRRGDPVLAEAILAEWTARGIPCGRNDSPHFAWDYGSIIPLQYMDPEGTIPVVLLPVCVLSDLDECFAAGDAVRAAAERTGKRVAMVASSSFAHQIRRGPDLWPPQEFMQLDAEFIRMLCAGRIAEAKAYFPEYARRVVCEMGGRVIGTMLGSLDTAHGARYAGVQHGPYGQSSASGNASVSVRRIH